MKIIAKKRRREGKTNYLKRMRLLEDAVKYTIISKKLLDYGWPKDKINSLKSIPAAYLTGLTFGKSLKNEKEAILDIGLIRSTKGSRIYAALKGIIDSGFNINHNKGILPREDKIVNDKNRDFFEKVKNNIMGEVRYNGKGKK